MARHFTSENLRALGSAAFLVRNTAWKCGRVEKMIIHHLLHTAKRSGKVACKVTDMVRHFSLEGKARIEFLDALKRLEGRYIVRLSHLRD